MTLCVSGVSESGDAIVSVFDRQLTLSDVASGVILAKSETAVKGVRVHDRWALFFAGDDIRHVGGIIDRLKNQLLDKPSVTLAQAQSTIVKTRNRVLRECVESEVLGPTGLTQSAFLRDGTRLIGDKAFYLELLRQVVNAKAGCDFLLAGFGKRRRMAHLVSILDGQYGTNHDREGYGAVGCGEHVAHQVINALGFSRELSLVQTAYILCAAKFAAEDDCIGRGTNVSVFRRDGSMWTFDADAVRAIWDRSTRVDLPVDLDREMPEPQLVTRPTAARMRRAAQSTPKSPKHGQKSRRPWRA